MTITELCTGCRTCEQLCPKHCISMREDDEGFIVATADESLCVDCGLCKKRCPQNRAALHTEGVSKTLAATLRDKDTLYKSASGGAFAGFAISVIRGGGVVFGARYGDDLRVIHAKAETMEELIPLLSSKYVQSDTKGTFKEVKSLLDNGRVVLYSGTGCQIAGLKSFLNKDYGNLILVDIICHGVPSPLLFKKYIELLQRKSGAKITQFDFRDKRDGWGLGYKYRYKYNRENKYGGSPFSPYYKYFLEGSTCRECCYQCLWARNERCSDITIGDYWGIEYFHPEFFNVKGVSLLLINTAIGEKFWNKVSSSFDFIESKLEYAVVKNGNLRQPTKRNAKVRDHIYTEIKTMSAENYFAEKMPLHPSLAVRIKSSLPMKVKLILKKMKRKEKL